MNDDSGRELRDRLRSAPLPPAPTGLQRRLDSVVTGPRQLRRPWPLGDRPALAPIVAAMLVVVALAAVSMPGGWLSEPGSMTPAPSSIALVSEPPGPTSAPTPRINCGQPIEADPAVTCEEAIALAMDALEADLPPIVGISVQRRCVSIAPTNPPPCTQTSILRVTFTFADIAPRTVTVWAASPGETPWVMPPRRDVSCEADDAWPGSITCAEAVEQAATKLDPGHPSIRRTVVHRFCLGSEGCAPPASALVEFEFDTVEPQVVRVWIPGSPDAWPIERGVRGDVICPEDDPSGGLVLDCRMAVDLVLRALEPDRPPIESVILRRGCPSEDGLIVDCWRYAYAFVEVSYATTPSITVQYFVRGDREPAVVEPRRT